MYVKAFVDFCTVDGGNYGNIWIESDNFRKFHANFSWIPWYTGPKSTKVSRPLEYSIDGARMEFSNYRRMILIFILVMKGSCVISNVIILLLITIVLLFLLINGFVHQYVALPLIVLQIMKSTTKSCWYFGIRESTSEVNLCFLIAFQMNGILFVDFSKMYGSYCEETDEIRHLFMLPFIHGTKRNDKIRSQPESSYQKVLIRS